MNTKTLSNIVINDTEVLPKKNVLSFKVVSNLNVFPLVDILNDTLREYSVNAEIILGQDSALLQEVTFGQKGDVLIVYWDLSQIVNYFCYRADLYDSESISSLLEQVKNELSLFLKYAHNYSLVLMNKFDSTAFKKYQFKTDHYCKVGDELNLYLEANVQPNVRLIDLNIIFAEIGVSNAIDHRFLMFARSLYTQAFYSSYCNLVLPIILNNIGVVKKVIIFDCDNTLWDGVVGEVGINGIRMSYTDRRGIPYAAIQTFAKALSNLGVIIAICSKNNPEDIDDVLNNHPDCVLRSENITIKMVNWDDKVGNILTIARKLNLSLDSMIFFDDASFEVERVRNALPGLTVLQVPENRSEYLDFFCDKVRSFLDLDALTNEDLTRKEVYNNILKRDEQKEQFQNFNDYLCSLASVMKICIDDHSEVSRFAQLCQRTNQFNLTTKRYTEGDIINFINSGSHNVFSFHFSDRFGNYGITGLAIIEYADRKAYVDTFLMSCRVIGRGAEYAFFNALIDYLIIKNCSIIESQFIKSDKNAVAGDFYITCGMKLASQSPEISNYSASLDAINCKPIPYIKVTKPWISN